MNTDPFFIVLSIILMVTVGTFAVISGKNIFLILFFSHLLSGVINQRLSLSVGGIGIVGFINILTILLAIPLFYSYKRMKFNCSLIYFIFPFLTCSLLAIFVNFSYVSFVQYGSKIFSLFAIYLLAQIYIKNTVDFEEKFIRFLNVFFLGATILGLYNAIQLGFNYELSKQKENVFSFIFFEYPHSFTIFISALTPIFLYYVFKSNNIFYKIILFVLLPVGIVFCGAKIGFITYTISLVFGLFFYYRKNIYSYILLGLLCLTLFYVLPQLDVFKDIKDVFSVSFDDYVHTSRTLNSFHTRIKVWSYMYWKLIQSNSQWFGLGWRSWSLEYQDLSGFVSSQSDYFTILFETGIFGIVSFVFYRVSVLYYFIMKSTKFNKKSYYLAIGILFSLYIGSFTENIEGYPSTSWLIPCLIAIGHYYNEETRKKYV